MKKTIWVALAAILYSQANWAQAQSEAKNADEETEVQPLLAPEPSADAELLAELTQPAPDATSVKVIVQKKQTIEEYRQRGELVLVKVIPNEGVPYFIDPLERDKLKGSGKDLINSGVKPVRWVLKEF